MSDKINLKKIIALSCSPSKGFNSDTMLDAFIAGCNEAPNAQNIQIEKIYLYDIPLEYYTFHNKTPDPATEPEFCALAEKLKTIDGLIIATPTHNFSVPGKLKNFIDRISFMALDYDHENWIKQPTGQLPHIKTFFLVSGGSPWWAQKLLFPIFPPFWLWVVFVYFGAHNRGSIFGGSLSHGRTAKANIRLMDKCRRRGKTFTQKL